MAKFRTALIILAFGLSLISPAQCQVYNSRDFFIMAADGTFLGNCSLNEYDSDSIFNEYGIHGGKYGSQSIWGYEWLRENLDDEIAANSAIAHHFTKQDDYVFTTNAGLIWYQAVLHGTSGKNVEDGI